MGEAVWKVLTVPVIVNVCNLYVNFELCASNGQDVYCLQGVMFSKNAMKNNTNI